MGEQGATGGAWGARDEASWWQSGAGELQQQQMNEEIARSTAANTHQLYTYKMTDGFSNNSTTTDNTPSTNYEYRIMSNSNNRGASTQQTWWYASGSVDAQQNSSPSAQNDSNSESKGNTNQSNGIQVVQQQEQNLQQNQLLQQQNLQQVMQQNQSLQIQQQQQQTLQQMLQQQQQQHQQQLQQQSQQALQQTIQSLSSAQAQALVQAQHVAQTLQHQQQTLQEQIQVVQQQQIQAALQRQSATLQELQQQAQQQALLAQANTPKPRMPRGRPLNKPRGRMTAYAFFVQTCREEHKKKHPDENVVFAAFSKKCAERWNTMSEKEKQRFHDMAEQDKRRYELEMQNYVPPKDVKVGRGRKRHQLKDPNAPKRSLSAFFWFCNDERSKVKGDNPEFTMGDIAKELGRRWAAVDSSCKSKYEALSEQDKARYDREMTAYKKGPLTLVTSKPDQQELEEDTVEYEVEEEYK